LGQKEHPLKKKAGKRSGKGIEHMKELKRGRKSLVKSLLGDA